jgi:hypothetical protein
MLWGLAMAAFAAVFVVIATRIVVNRTAKLSETQELLSAAKVRQLQSDLKGKDIEIGNLNLLVEQERLARVELQKLVQWRTISPEQQKAIAARLKRFPGVRIAFSVNAGDPESFAFATEIATAAAEAGWSIIAFAPIVNLGAFRTGGSSDGNGR